MISTVILKYANYLIVIGNYGWKTISVLLGYYL